MRGCPAPTGTPVRAVTSAVLALILAAALFSCAPKAASPVEGPAGEGAAARKSLEILQSYSGDYPVSELRRLPPGQENGPVGFIGSQGEFAPVWQAMFPSRPAPEIDFSASIVIFSRNVHFYNRTSIGSAVLADGVVDILAVETRSAMPIGDKVAMVLAVIPRAGVRYIRTGTGLVPVMKGSASDPLSTAYTVDGREVRLSHGRAEEAVPGTAAKITTVVFGAPVYGDLDNDGRADAALILVRDPGASGAFYYVVASLSGNGEYRGTNAVLLGDRVAPHGVEVQDGSVVVSYAVRRPGKAMTDPPSEGRTMYLKVEQGSLKEIGHLSIPVKSGARSFVPKSSPFAEITAGPEDTSAFLCGRLPNINNNIKIIYNLMWTVPLARIPLNEQVIRLARISFSSDALFP